MPKNRLTTSTAIVLQSLEVSVSLYLQYTLHIDIPIAVTQKIIHTLLKIINIPVGKPTKVKPYLVEAASKLERGLGRFVGDSNIRISLICLKLKSQKLGKT